MRGRGLPPHHLFPRPSGCSGALYCQHHRRKGRQSLLLSNGNFLGGAGYGEGKHFAAWFDPHPKPSYLFALVAGDLGVIEDTFTTMSGREVALKIYVEHGKEPRAAYAMDALKRSMKWDEEAFGREYDLDIFMIVAVSDFNMGAMENKGLNIFNDKYVLADPQTATDADYANIEAIIAHEYFHNWTGNRITCRDWFQLCLKEGLTVYRDHEFSSDQRSRPVKRIAEVRHLKSEQFPEDAGPLAHPVRPTKYREINNFYTTTVYEKGSEVTRMIATLLGKETFKKGMDVYFDRHDGQAVTIEDFVKCFEDASGRDLGSSRFGTTRPARRSSPPPAATMRPPRPSACLWSRWFRRRRAKPTRSRCISRSASPSSAKTAQDRAGPRRRSRIYRRGAASHRQNADCCSPRHRIAASRLDQPQLFGADQPASRPKPRRPRAARPSRDGPFRSLAGADRSGIAEPAEGSARCA
ncbi:hypothetical protein AJ87_12305 [Rhizobium yanglingense]|nr:hypothetical protein AJ87_12305 [Rhizobium yanglingense]